MADEGKFLRPGFFARACNRILLGAGRAGVSVAGSRVLTVVGRKTGLARSTPVNPLVLATETYLVAARGNTHWARNLRSARTGELTLGRTATPFTAVELSRREKIPILRIYLAKWSWEVGSFFHLPKNPTDEAIEAIADAHPVFRIELQSSQRR